MAKSLSLRTGFGLGAANDDVVDRDEDELDGVALAPKVELSP